jgi:hypothetical protein
MNQKYVLVNFKNAPPFVQKFISKKEIKFSDILQYMEENEEFNMENDSLTLINNPEDGAIEL